MLMIKTQFSKFDLILIGKASANARTISPREKRRYYSVWLNEMGNSCSQDVLRSEVISTASSASA